MSLEELTLVNVLKEKPSYGRCPSKKQTYFGFKFHALTTIDGFLTDYVITPAKYR